jgi:thiamine pyrophosphate-dependent acetolactate synthase large subunit-like protein
MSEVGFPGKVTGRCLERCGGEAVVNGAEAIIRTAKEAGIEVCFANPATTELPHVVALDSVEGIRSILGGIDWAALGRRMGVLSVRAATADALAREIGKAIREQGPHLIERVI